MNWADDVKCRSSGPGEGPCANCYLLGRKCVGGTHAREGKPLVTKPPMFDVHRAAHVIAYMIFFVLVFCVATALFLGILTWLRVEP